MKSLKSYKYRIITLAVFLVLVLANCGIDTFIYLATPEETESGLLSADQVGCEFPSEDNDDSRDLLATGGVMGFDVFYSFFPAADTTDVYLSALTVSKIKSAALTCNYPITVSGQAYWKVFKDGDNPSVGVSVNPFNIISARINDDFNVVLDLYESNAFGDDHFFETTDLGSTIYAGSETLIYRFIKEDESSGTEKTLKNFDLDDDDEDVVNFVTKYSADSPTSAYVYFYFFIWGMDSGLSKYYCDHPLKIAIPVKIDIGG